MTTSQMHNLIGNLMDSVEDQIRAYARCCYAGRMYLYCKASAGRSAGVLLVAMDSAQVPEGFLPATAEPIPQGCGENARRNWLRDLVRRLPVLPVE